MKARTPGLPQINATQGLYGQLDPQLLPAAGQQGDMYYWDHLNQEWRFIRIVGGVGLNVDFNSDTNELVITLSDAVTAGSFTADAVLQGTQTGTFTADADLVV